MSRLTLSTSFRSIRTALDTVRFELDATARSHLELSGAMKKEYEADVAAFADKLGVVRKNVRAMISCSGS